MIHLFTSLLFVPFLLIWLLIHPWRHTKHVARYRKDGQPDLRYAPIRKPIWSSSILGFLVMALPALTVSVTLDVFGLVIKAFRRCRTAWRKYEDEKLFKACRAKWVSGAPYR